jgi:amidophosphoribosyltransferase
MEWSPTSPGRRPQALGDAAGRLCPLFDRRVLAPRQRAADQDLLHSGGGRDASRNPSRRAPARRGSSGRSIFQSTSDTEVILPLSPRSPYEAGRGSDRRPAPEGAPLVSSSRPTSSSPSATRGFAASISRIGDSWCVASESCAFDLIAQLVRDARAHGEMSPEPDGPRRPRSSGGSGFAVHLIRLLSRPDSSSSDAASTSSASGSAPVSPRAPGRADIVIPVRLGRHAALSYAPRLGIPFEMGLVRNHYVGRTFISRAVDSPLRRQDQAQPREGAALRQGVVSSATDRPRHDERKIVSMIKEAARRGPRPIPARPRRPLLLRRQHAEPENYIASSHSVEEIGATSARRRSGYLSHEGLVAAVGEGPPGEGGFAPPATPSHPVPMTEQDRSQLHLFDSPAAEHSRV